MNNPKMNSYQKAKPKTNHQVNGKEIQEEWDSATDGRDTLLYMFKNSIT